MLGVDRTASSDEIRRVYVDLARRNHPDYHQGADPTARAATERRMQHINEAWDVLGNTDRRRAYDRDLALADEAVVADVPTRAWRPFDDDEGLDDVDPRDLIDDIPIGDGGRPPRALTLAPAFFFALTVAGFAFGLVTRLPFLLALGLASFVLLLLSLVAAPLVALAKSWQSEHASGL